MKNNALKQANALINWLEANDIELSDVNVTAKLKDESLFKIMNDGSIIKISNGTDGNKTFNDASEAIASFDIAKETKDTIYMIKVRTKK